MNWHDLLFMHWPVPVDALRPHVPSPLSIDTCVIPSGPHAGARAAWLGIVPFRMTGVRHCLLPPLPALGAFPEINVRTYVTGPGADGQEGRPGVWFFSLDVPSIVVAQVARSTYHLNYLVSRMRCDVSETQSGVLVNYESRRADRRGGTAEYAAKYAPDGPEFTAAGGSLEYFLTERYCLYSSDRHGRIFRADISHTPWPLQPARCRVRTNTMAAPLGIDLAAVERRTGPALLHFARLLKVRAWLPRRVM